MNASRTPRKKSHSAYRGMQAYGSNLAYDFGALERRRPQERPQPKPQIRTIRRPDVAVRPAERVSALMIAGFAAAGVLLALVVFSYVQLTVLSDSVVALQSRAADLETENVTLMTTYERAFDLATVEAAAQNGGMSKPSTSQVYYLDMDMPDSASVYETNSGGVLGGIFSSLGRGVYAVVEYFA